VRLQVVERYLSLRGAGAQDPHKWHTIIDEAFSLHSSGTAAATLLAALSATAATAAAGGAAAASAASAAASAAAGSSAAAAAASASAAAMQAQQQSAPVTRRQHSMRHHSHQSDVVAPPSTVGAAVAAAAGTAGAANSSSCGGSASHLRGIPQVLADLSDLQALLDEVGRGTPEWDRVHHRDMPPAERERLRVRLVFTLDRGDVAMGESALMAPWHASTVNAVYNGAPAELCLNGKQLVAVVAVVVVFSVIAVLLTFAGGVVLRLAHCCVTLMLYLLRH
jgi:hypothetical protein